MDLIIRQVTWLTLLSWLMILTALLLSVCLSDTWDATMVLLWVTSIFLWNFAHRAERRLTPPKP